MGEIQHALEAKVIQLHTKIKARYKTVDAQGEPQTLVIDTTAGRMMMADLLPRHRNVPVSVLNTVLTKKEISNLIDVVYRHCGQKETVIFCDRMMKLGFRHACLAGISFGKDEAETGV
jgi:DNA-directed RNA polymerase subunit beta'